MKHKFVAVALAATAIIAAAQVSHAGRDAPRCENGLLEVHGTNGDFTFKGYCERAIVAGGDNKVVLGDVGTLEVRGSNHDVTAGNVERLALAGGDNAVKLGNVGTASIAGSDHDVATGVIGTMEVVGGNNGVKAERIGSVTVRGSDHLIEYRKLNPNAKNPNKPTHPARNVQGSSNLVRWNESAYPW
jgi:hypothetical protein